MTLVIVLGGLALAEPDQVLRHARIWDGTGGPVIADGWLSIEDGLVTGLGAEPLPEEVAGPELDLGGATVIPGLVDAHTHPWAVPGAALRGDDEASLEAARKRGLRSFLACGFTTILDTGASWDQVETMRGWLDAGEPGPRTLTLGPVVGPPGGYVEAFLPEHPGVGTLAQAEAHLDRLAEIGAVGVKLTIEPGYILPVLPMHSDELRAQIVAAAAARDLPVFVHAQHRDAHRAALDLGVAGVLHMVRQPPGDLVARYAETGTPLVTTLALEASPLVRFDEARLDRPLARLVVPEDQRHTATSGPGWRAYKRGMTHVSVPGWPPWMVGLAGGAMPLQDYLRATLRRVQRTTAALHAAGARLVMGSDSGAYDVIPSYFHGVHGLTELELLVEAGLSPEQALLAATREPAAMLGRQGELGVLAPGAAADLMVLDSDPLADITALWSPRLVMRDGELRTPEGWMGGPGRAAGIPSRGSYSSP